MSRPSGGFPLRRLFAALPLFFLAGGLDAQNSFKTGEEFFLNNKPADAVSYLERAAEEDPAHVTAFLYLGMAYMQLDRVDEAVAVYLKILPRGGDETARIAYNLGNAYYVKGNTASAGQYYTQAIEADPAYASAYLNRANALVRSGALRDALPDYERYLSLEPRSEKRPQIERLTAFIREEFAAEERRRILAEEAARAEAERRRRLLEEVSASLQSAAENSKSLSSGTEEVENYEGEFELE
ncbi:MAG: tetratricopeptide repeat protein [Treponema sp.]|nr:tetratricopeptide repeat protein [Treponema sp.]